MLHVRLAASQALGAFQDESAISDLQRPNGAEGDEFVREQMKAALRQPEKQ